MKEDLCGGRNKMFEYQVVEFDESKKPLLCLGWVSDVSFATEPQYVSIAVSHNNSGEGELVHQQRFNYRDEILSNREIQIVRLLVEGNTSQDVADELSISVKTVNNHRQNILRKLGAKSTSEVIRYAVMRGHY
ncbi:MAG: LuxR C-terminal-related transcriptional regulator [Bacteroidota bacterium]